jgi:elongation factor Tu
MERVETPQLSVHIRLLRPDEGGRRGPVVSGYRPTFYFGRASTDGSIQLIGTDKAFPGEEFEAQVILLHPEHVEHALKPGVHFEIKEGLHKVAEGEVLSILEGV